MTCSVQPNGQQFIWALNPQQINDLANQLQATNALCQNLVRANSDRNIFLPKPPLPLESQRSCSDKSDKQIFIESVFNPASFLKKDAAQRIPHQSPVMCMPDSFFDSQSGYQNKGFFRPVRLPSPFEFLRIDQSLMSKSFTKPTGVLSALQQQQQQMTPSEQQTPLCHYRAQPVFNFSLASNNKKQGVLPSIFSEPKTPAEGLNCGQINNFLTFK